MLEILTRFIRTLIPSIFKVLAKEENPGVLSLVLMLPSNTRDSGWLRNEVLEAGKKPRGSQLTVSLPQYEGASRSKANDAMKRISFWFCPQQLSLRNKSSFRRYYFLTF
jgi:hypothetical protein